MSFKTFHMFGVRAESAPLLAGSSARRATMSKIPRRAEQYIRRCCFSAQILRANKGQIAPAEHGGGRVSRSVWSAWSLLPLSDVWRGSKAGASSTHSIRFAPFGSGSAGLRTDAPYPPLLLRHYARSPIAIAAASCSPLPLADAIEPLRAGGLRISKCQHAPGAGCQRQGRPVTV